MKKYSCPSCSGEILVHSPTSLFMACTGCHAAIARNDNALEVVGKAGDLSQDTTQLQVGTKGKHGGKSFELVGRTRITANGDSWNEWYAQCSDGSAAWISETEHNFVFSLETPLKRTPESLRHVRVSEAMKLDANMAMFYVDDVKQATCQGAQGELPFKGVQGRKSVIVDLSSDDGGFANIDISDESGARLSVGEEVEFEDFHFTNLRK